MTIYEVNVMNIEVIPYLSFAEKKSMIVDVLAKAIDYSDGYAKIDSIKEYTEFQIHLVEAYAGIEFSKEFAARSEEYDEMCRNCIYEIVVKEIGHEADVCRKLLRMARADVEKEYSVQASVAKMATNLTDGLDVIISALEEKIREFDIDPKTLVQMLTSTK